ncbi:MAG: peptide ABC transporter substrate-binding protein [Armatimonadetes bacterium]|nr:peptide ABC transporter substrate-binding protein [Armatimonadota bacterium]MDE2205183.1 peptide ABC transporter substrate-binding protein [Armatimonadota bacterium]
MTKPRFQPRSAIRLSRRQVLAAAAAGAGAAITGCTTGRSGPGGPIHLTKNTLHYAINSDPTSLDPATVEDGMTIDLLQQIFEGLVRWDTHNQIVPNLAAGWTVSKDLTRYTFHLRPDIKFFNGRTVTAEDFRWSMDRACDPAIKSPTAPTYLKDVVGAQDRIDGKADTVTGIKAIDDTTLEITIDGTKPYWMGNLTYPTAWVVCREAIERTNGAVTRDSMVGTGPFKLAEFRNGYRVVLARNAAYHGGPPKLDFIERPVIMDGDTRLNQYIAGDCDYLEISPSDLDRIDTSAGLKAQLHTYPRAELWYVALNQAASGSPFVNMRVRQAIALAINKQEVVRIALRNTCDVANSIVPPEVPGYAPHIKPMSFDPAAARSLLAQAGFAGGKGFPALPFAFRQDQPEVADVAQVIAAQLKTNLGITLQLKPMEWTQLLQERLQKTLAIYIIRWAADYLDPQDFLSVLLHTSHLVNGQEDHPENGVGYSNPVFDKLCDEADTCINPRQRFAWYAQAEQIAVNEAPWVPLYFRRALELDKPRLHGIRDSVFGHLPHTTTWVSG